MAAGYPDYRAYKSSYGTGTYGYGDAPLGHRPQVGFPTYLCRSTQLLYFAILLWFALLC